MSFHIKPVLSIWSLKLPTIQQLLDLRIARPRMSQLQTRQQIQRTRAAMGCLAVPEPLQLALINQRRSHVVNAGVQVPTPEGPRSFTPRVHIFLVPGFLYAAAFESTVDAEWFTRLLMISAVFPVDGVCRGYRMRGNIVLWFSGYTSRN
jgi:hypothetical protein